MRRDAWVALAIAAAVHAAVVVGIRRGAAPVASSAAADAGARPFEAYLRAAVSAPMAAAPVAQRASVAPSAPQLAHAAAPVAQRAAGAPQVGFAAYIAAHDLDQKMVTASEPDFSDAMARHPVFAPVRLRVYVSTLGPPDRVEVLSGAPQVGADLADALRRTRFVPGKRGGRDVAAFVDLEFSAAPVITAAASGAIATR